MDPMDIDSMVDVPDTPDRLAAGNTKGKSSMERGRNDKSRIGLRANDNRSRKFSPRAPRSHHGSSSATAPGNSFSKNSFPFRRLACNDASSYDSGHTQSTESDKVHNTISSGYQGGSVEDLTEQTGHANKGKSVVSFGPSGGGQAVENGKNLLAAVQLHSQQHAADSLVASRIHKGNENLNTVSAIDRGKGVEFIAITQPKAGKIVSAAPTSISSSRVTGQKRLVRNGCISPCNIAKAQQIVGRDNNGTVDDGRTGPCRVSSSGSQAGVHSIMPVGDTQSSNVSKGKGIMTYPALIEEHGGQNANNRDIVSINEIVEEADDNNKGTFSSLGGLGGWRSTHNRSKKLTFSSSEEHRVLPMDHGSSSRESPPMPPLRQRLHHVRSQLNQRNGNHPVTDMTQKRQKPGSSSIQDNCSGSTFDDSGIMFLGSSGDTIESRPTRSRRRNQVDTVGRVVEIDEGNCGARGDGSNGASSGKSEDAMTRQIEADEMLALELQEQLYNEDLGARVGEIGPQEALDLQHENGQHAFPRRSRHAFSARSASTANSSRLPRVRRFVNVARSGAQARASFHSGMDRFRNRFPGRPRTLSSSGEESSLFPSGMDVDLRMSILEALETFNDMGVDNTFLEIHREFNENDYEMLLALDENNHRHSGASTSRINDLPQSTIQNDNCEEACAVCLETPTTGDIIRHLPCLHKFHKDCIDPWLRRKSSCPVCKSSIT